MLSILNNKYSFINLNSFKFKRLNNNISSKKKILLKKYFKKEILEIDKGELFFYAGARMGIYSILKYLNLKKNEEVIVTAFTCSVVINAIKKLRLKPIYVDIDHKTLGTSYLDLKKKITKKTKLIIVQHSFGIPCQIDKITKLAKKNKIFLLEDCSISIGSKINNKTIGTFGDASVFSFDHTKPLNCFVGGALYVKKKKLINFLENQEKNLKPLPRIKIDKMIQRFKFENLYCNYTNFKKYIFLNKFINILNRLTTTPYLDEDLDPFGRDKTSYPYPCEIPSFALNCLKDSIRNFKNKNNQNIRKLKYIIKHFKKNNILGVDHYITKNLDKIYPFRFVWIDKKNNINYSKLSNYINIKEIWFKQPIINLTENISFYDYKNNCINSNQYCKRIINLPNSIPMEKLIIILKKIYE
jgi:perosamine synthetase